MPRWLDPRRWWRRIRRAWRTSLHLRTITTTVLLSAVAALAVGLAINLAVGGSLFEARRDQVLTLSQNATIAGQRVFDDAQADAEFDSVLTDAVRAVLSAAATTSGGTSYAIVPISGPAAAPFPATNTPGLDIGRLATADLRDAAGAEGNDLVYWQSVAVAGTLGAVPGIITASPLTIQSTPYLLYLVYDISDTAETRGVVQLALALAGLALVVLIGLVTWVVLRLVVGPIEVAAATSRRLAAGELEVRLPEQRDDVLGTLARSFNGMAENLRNRITQLAELSTLQQRFVSDVSHELRTPLTTIRLAGDLLYDRRTDLGAENSRTVELLHTQVQRFEELLADLLEMSRFDAGAVEMEVEPTNLARLVEDEVASMQSLAGRKGSDLVLEAEGGFVTAEIDPRRVRRILTNLIGNAVDHGEGRPIEVWVSSDRHAVAVAVRDHGVGIAPANLDRVFDRFWRADPSRQRMTGGSGLGLAISLEDAALHGGWLEAWSAPGEGSCFRLTLPRQRGGALTGSPLGLPPGGDA